MSESITFGSVHQKRSAGAQPLRHARASCRESLCQAEKEIAGSGSIREKNYPSVLSAMFLLAGRSIHLGSTYSIRSMNAGEARSGFGQHAAQCRPPTLDPPGLLREVAFQTALLRACQIARNDFPRQTADKAKIGSFLNEKLPL